MVNLLIDKNITTTEACRCVGLPKSTFYHKKKPKSITNTDNIKHRDANILHQIKNIKSEHPFWGYRRVWANLKYSKCLLINKKKIYRIMKENHLLEKVKLKKVSRSHKKKPKASYPRQFWGIDMTKIMIDGYGWVYLVIVLDWYTKRIVGWDLSMSCKTDRWLKAIDMAISSEYPYGVRDQSLKLISDNGVQPSSGSFMMNMSLLTIKQIFTTYNNPKGNAETERMMRTIKEELIWINEYENITELNRAIEAWISYYNHEYLHSALGYKSPEMFEKLYYETNKVA